MRNNFWSVRSDIKLPSSPSSPSTLPSMLWFSMSRLLRRRALPRWRLGGRFCVGGGRVTATGSVVSWRRCIRRCTIWYAVRFRSSVRCRSQPAVTNSFTTATCPRLQANNRAVEFCFVWWLTRAPCWISWRHIWACPRCAANMRGVIWASFSRLAFVSYAKSKFTVDKRPSCAARINGVVPVVLGVSIISFNDSGQNQLRGSPICSSLCVW